MVGLEQSFHHSEESFKDPQVLTSEAKHQASIQQILGYFSGSTSNIQQVWCWKLDILLRGHAPDMVSA